MNFAAGGVATPADAALMMELGAEGVFVGSGIFKSGDPEKCAAAIVQAVANWQDSKLLAKPRCERLARGSWKSITACEPLAPKKFFDKISIAQKSWKRRIRNYELRIRN